MTTVVDGYRERLVDPLISRLLSELPAVFLVGPRSFALGDRISAVPVRSLWAPPTG